MGVNSLWDVLGPTAHPVRLDALSRKRLAVDASIWIYQFLKAVRDSDGNTLPQSHIVGFFRRICKLLYYGILPVFVFDGGAPVLKRQTIMKRRERRLGQSQSVRELAQKLFAMQVQKGTIRGKKKLQSTAKEKPDEMVFLEDLPMAGPGQHMEQSPVTETQSKSFVKKDEYHLPVISEFRASKNDDRIMAREEYDSMLPEDIDSADFDIVDGVDINLVDPDSKEFLDLPLSTQYMILSHLRLKSRLRMGYRKEQLEAVFPNSMDFSKFQIQQVQKRNFYTQKLMVVSGMDKDVGNVTKRIAGDKDRKYMLAKNDDGYTLSLSDGGKTNPIVLDEDGQEIRSVFEPKKEMNDEEDDLKIIPKTWMNGEGSLDSNNSHKTKSNETKINLHTSDSSKSTTTSKPTDLSKNTSNSIDLTELNNSNVPDSPSSESSSDFEDIPLEEKPETEEERQRSMALIQSMYDQFAEPEKKPSVAEPRGGIFGFGDFDENDMRSAIEESKRDLVNLEQEEMKRATELSRRENARHGEYKEWKTVQSEENMEQNHKEYVKIGKDEIVKEGEDIKNHEKKDKNHHYEDKQTIDDDLGSSFLFSGSIEQKKLPNESGKTLAVKSLENSDTTTPSIPSDTKILPKPQNPSDSLHANAEEKPSSVTAKIVSEIPESPGQSSESEPEPEPQPAPREVPTWFEQDVTQQYLHDKPLFTLTTVNDRYREDEEAGLISWNEAKDLLESDENEDNAGDDIREIHEAEFVNNRVLEAPQSNDIEDKASSNQSTSTSRRAQLMDYDYEEDEEKDLAQQFRNEEEDHESFKHNLLSGQEIPIPLANTRIGEEQLLQEQLERAKRDSDEVTETMINDVQELLRRFGIPYITAPMEAEAQCAELFHLGLVDGIITDDSDCFLFGGDRVYKNMFNQKQFVECYIMNEIEPKVGLTQDKMIELALMLGSDYTEGIKGIGPVLAMEILAEFGTVKAFKAWFDECAKMGSRDQANMTGLRKTLVGRIASGKLFLPDNFPENVVVEAYKNPEVDHDKSEFKWGVPHLDEIRSFLMYNVNWSQERVDEVMIPLIRDINKRKKEGTQSTLGEFFPQEYIQARKELAMGKRLKTAADKLNKRRKKTED